MDTYASQLLAAKSHYPFLRWEQSGLVQYTEEACQECSLIVDNLIETLTQLGKEANEQKKVEAFREAVLAFNVLNEKDDSLIETGEREDLCALFDIIAIAVGINPNDYGSGEGIASQWRDW